MYARFAEGFRFVHQVSYASMIVSSTLDLRQCIRAIESSGFTLAILKCMLQCLDNKYRLIGQ